MATEEIVRIKFEGISSVREYQGAIQDTQKDIDKLKARQKELKSSNDENSKQFIKNATDLKVLSDQQRENRRNLVNLKKAKDATTGSIKEQRARLATLKNQYIGLSKEERENSKIGKALQKEIKGVTDELKKQEKEIGITSRNVGNYSDSIVDATTNMGFFGTATRTVVQGFKQGQAAIKGFTFGLKGLRAAIAATGIGLLVVGLGSLVTFFTSTKRGAETLQRATAFLGAAFSVITDRVSALGERLFKAFSDPKQLLVDFGNTLQSFVISKVTALTKGFGFLSDAIGAVFTGDLDKAKEAASQAGQELSKLTPTILQIEEGSSSVGQAIAGLTKEILEEGNAALELEGRLQKLRDAERALQIQQAERRTEINKLRQTVKDETNTFEERQEALTKAQALQNQLADEEIKLQAERVAIIEQQLALGENLEEDEQNLADARTRLAEIEEERQKRLVKFVTEQNLITNQQVAVTKKLEDIRRKGLKDATKLEQEFLDEIRKTRIKGEEDDLTRSLLQLDFKHDQEIRKIQEKFNKVAKLDEAELARIAELEEKELTKANQKDIEELERLRAKRAAQLAAEDEFNQLILEKDKAFLDEKTKLLNQQQVETLEILQSVGQAVGQEFVNTLNDQQKSLKDFLKFTITLLLDELQKVTLAAIAKSQIQAATTAPFGLGRAALQIAAIQALFSGAKVAISKFEHGGLVDGGMFQGASHAQGGIKFASGGRIMEAEGGEAIINKRSTSMFKPLLSAINQIGGGKKFQTGGITPSIAPELANPLLSLSLSNQTMGAEISDIIAARINDLRVINVVSDTTDKQISINNVESEAIF